MINLKQIKIAKTKQVMFFTIYLNFNNNNYTIVLKNLPKTKKTKHVNVTKLTNKVKKFNIN